MARDKEKLRIPLVEQDGPFASRIAEPQEHIDKLIGVSREIVPTQTRLCVTRIERRNAKPVTTA